MGHEQKIALENLSRHIEVEDMDTVETLHSELSEIDSLKEKHVYKLLEVMPEFESTVRAIFSKERVRLEDGDIEAILDVTGSVDSE